MAMQPIPVRRDPRGIVFEPLGAHELQGMRNVHVVVTLPGHVRGNHYHTRGTESLSVLGPALVRSRRDSVVEEQSVPEGEVWRFTFPPRASHAVLFTGAEPGLLVSFSDVAHEPAEPDSHPDPLFTEDEIAAHRP